MYFSYDILDLGDVMKFIKKILFISILVIPFFIGMKEVNAAWEVEVLDYSDKNTCINSGYIWLDDGYINRYENNSYFHCVKVTNVKEDSISRTGQICEVKYYSDDVEYLKSTTTLIYDSYTSSVLYDRLENITKQIECPNSLPILKVCGNKNYCTLSSSYTCDELKAFVKTDSTSIAKEFNSNIGVCPDGYYKVISANFKFNNYCRKCENYEGMLAVSVNNKDELKPYLKTCNILSGEFSYLWKLILIAAPILLILFGGFDLFKAVVSSDEKQIKKTTNNLLKRAIITVAIFLLPTIVNLVIGFTKYSDLDACIGNTTTFESEKYFDELDFTGVDSSSGELVKIPAGQGGGTSKDINQQEER